MTLRSATLLGLVFGSVACDDPAAESDLCGYAVFYATILGPAHVVDGVEFRWTAFPGATWAIEENTCEFTIVDDTIVPIDGSACDGLVLVDVLASGYELEWTIDVSGLETDGVTLWEDGISDGGVVDWSHRVERDEDGCTWNYWDKVVDLVPECDTVIDRPDPTIDCTGVFGELDESVIVTGPEDAALFDGIRDVTGSVVVEGTSLTDLDFLACVERIQGDLDIRDNDALVDVSGLWSLNQVGGRLSFVGNDALTDFDGAPNLQVVGTEGSLGGDLTIASNAALQTITGFHALIGVNGDIVVRDHPQLWHIIGLAGLRFVGDQLLIVDNPQLCLSTVNCVGEGIVMPDPPPETWSTEGNYDEC